MSRTDNSHNNNKKANKKDINIGNNEKAGIKNCLFDETKSQETKDFKFQCTQVNLLSKSSQDKQEKMHKINGVVWNNLKYKTQLLAIDSGGILTVFDVTKTSDKIIYKIEASKTWLTSVDVDKVEGRRVACGTLDNKILIFEINTSQNKTGKNFNINKPMYELMGHSGAIQCVQFLNSNYLIAGSTDSMVSVWDLENTQRYISIHQKHNGEVLCMSVYENDPNIFLTGSSDLTCKIWDIRVKNPVQQEFRGHQSAINSVKFMPLNEPTTFATGSDDSTIKLFDLRLDKDYISQYTDDSKCDGIHSIAFSNTGRLIFAGTESNDIKVWDVLGSGSKMGVGIPTKFEKTSMIKSIDMSADRWALGVAGNTPGDIAIIY